MEDKKLKFGGMRRFRLDRHSDPTGVSGTGCVAQGVVFSDGTTVIRWMSGKMPTTTVHDSVASVEAIHLHEGRTAFRWEDPICFQCGCEISETGGLHCFQCGASTSEPYKETRPNPSLGTWRPAVTIEGTNG